MWQQSRVIRCLRRHSRPAIIAASALASLLGGCAQMGTPSFDLLSSKEPGRDEREVANATPQTELQKATEYWGNQYSKHPRDVEAALSYAKNLKAMGQKQAAMSVLQQVAMIHGNDRRVASEYGRLALDLDQVSLAAQVLEGAEDPAKPDWRVVAARGTVLAKQGKYSDAVPFYERALTLAPGQPSILNNLALAHTMSGNSAKGEELLRQAAAAQGATPRVKQNLALVLGIEGKYDESKQVAAAVMAPNDAAANADLIRRMTRNDPKASGPTDTAPAATDAPVQVAKTAPDARSRTTPATTDAPAQVARKSPSAAPVKTVAAQRPAAGNGWTTVVADGDTGPPQPGPALRDTAQ